MTLCFCSEMLSKTWDVLLFSLPCSEMVLCPCKIRFPLHMNTWWALNDWLCKEKSKPKVRSKGSWEIFSLKWLLVFSVQLLLWFMLGSSYLLVSFSKQNHRAIGWPFMYFWKIIKSLLLKGNDQIGENNLSKALVAVTCVQRLCIGEHGAVHSFFLSFPLVYCFC